jgi:hypothetical protein
VRVRRGVSVPRCSPGDGTAVRAWGRRRLHGGSAHFPPRKSPIVSWIGLIRKEHGEKHGPRSHKTRHETVRLAVPTRCPLGRVGQTAAHLLSLGPGAGATSRYLGCPRGTSRPLIRNNKTYTAKTAAQFLRGKWRAKQDEITTVQDFIAKVASVSSTTGQPYRIRFPDGHEVRSGDYLRMVLQQLAPPS